MALGEKFRTPTQFMLPICRMDGRGRDKVVSELKVATLRTFVPKSALTFINKKSTWSVDGCLVDHVLNWWLKIKIFKCCRGSQCCRELFERFPSISILLKTYLGHERYWHEKLAVIWEYFQLSTSEIRIKMLEVVCYYHVDGVEVLT